MVAHRDHLHPVLHQLANQLRGCAQTARGIFPVCDRQINAMLFAQRGQQTLDAVPPGARDHVADEQNPQRWPGLFRQFGGARFPDNRNANLARIRHLGFDAARDVTRKLQGLRVVHALRQHRDADLAARLKA